MRSLTLEEQEVIFTSSRDSDKMQCYTTDTTYITKMNKLVAKNPELFKVVAENEVSRTYEFPKKLLSIRSCFKVLTEEQKEACRKRFAEHRNTISLKK